MRTPGRPAQKHGAQALLRRCQPDRELGMVKRRITGVQQELCPELAAACDGVPETSAAVGHVRRLGDENLAGIQGLMQPEKAQNAFQMV